MKRAWLKWKSIAKKLGEIQFKSILVFFYFTLLLIPGIIKIITRRLSIKGKTHWFIRENRNITIDDLRKQS